MKIITQLLASAQKALPQLATRLLPAALALASLLVPATPAHAAGGGGSSTAQMRSWSFTSTTINFNCCFTFLLTPSCLRCIQPPISW